MHPEGRAAAVDDQDVIYFWNWCVRNPLFLIGGLALLAGVVQILEWPLALSVATVAALAGDAAWHLARKARMRRYRKLAAAAAAKSNAHALERFTDYNLGDREKVA